MYSIILALSLLVSADMSEQEDMLLRVDRLDRQLTYLLKIYDDVISSESEKNSCLDKIRNKYSSDNKEFDYNFLILGSKNTILDLKINLLKDVIAIYEKQLKKVPNDLKLKNKLKEYKKRYEELKAFPGYD